MRVTDAKVIGPHRLRVRFKDGYEAELDLSTLPTLYPIFAGLKDTDVFRTVKVEANTVAWGDLDICPDVLRAWSEAGRVLSKEQTEQHFAYLQNQPAVVTK